MIETSPPPNPARVAYQDLPAGWDPDPCGRHQLRYWDGTCWTQWVSDFDVLSQDPLMSAAPASAPSSNGHGTVEQEADDSVGDVDDGGAIPSPPDAPDASDASDASARELADRVERLVHHLRDLSRRNRRIGTDVELSDLAAAALRQARVVQGRPLPEDER